MILKAILGENGKLKISEADFNALKAYNDEISNGVSPMTAYYKTLQNASDKVVELASSAGKAGVNLDKLTVRAKTGQKALKALKVASNMLAGMAISFAITKGIELLSKAIDDLNVTNEEYLEQQDEIISKNEEIINSTESRIESLEGLKEKLDETNGSQARMLELTSDINNVLGDGKSKILDNANALAILNAEIENELRLEKERQDLANKEIRDASFNKAKRATSTETAYLNEELTFSDIQNEKYGTAYDDDLSIGKKVSEYIESHLNENDNISIQDVIGYYVEAIKHRNDVGYGEMKISEKEMTEAMESALKDLYVAFEDVINNGEGFLSKTYKQNIIDALYLRAGGVIDDEWRENVYEAINVLDSLTEDVHGALEEYNKALTDDIEGNEDIIYESVLSLFDNIKKRYPEISSIIDTWLSDMVTSLQNNIPGKITVDRASIINDIKDKFGIYFQDKTVETFFETNSIDTDEEIIKFKTLAKEAKSLAEVMKKYVEVSKTRFTLSPEDAEVLSEYQSRIDKLSSSYSNLYNLTTKDITSLMTEFEDFEEVFERFGVDGTAGAGDVKSVIEEIGKELAKAAKEKVPQMTNAIQEMYEMLYNPKGSESKVSSEIEYLMDVLERVNNNKAFSVDEINSLLTKYDLAGNIEKLERGGTSFERDAIVSLINERIKTYNEIIPWEIAKLEAILEENIQNMGIAEYNAISKQIYELKNSHMELLETSEESELDKLLKEFDNQFSHYENEAKYIEAQLANAEARGYIANEAYYKALQDVELDNHDLLEQKLADLKELMKNSGLKENSEEWHELQNEIEETTIALQESKNKMLEFYNQSRQIDWDIFDFSRDRESKFMDEADFLIDLMDRADKFNDEMNSANVLDNLTSEGMATMGLHAANYNAYLEQSIKHSKELAELQKQIEDDKGNTELINRYDDLLEKQQEAILSAEAEKDAMIDLVSEGIEAQKEAFQGLIDEYTEALDVQKDLYDYQKKNSEQTKKIAQIQKQLAAYSGDQSEEARAKVQQLKVQLDEEQDALESDQYDRYISDQKEILTSISEDYNAALDAYLDNTTKVITDSINAVNKNTSDINTAVSGVAKDVGYEISDEFAKTFGENGATLKANFKEVSSSITGVLTPYTTSTTEILKAMATDIHNISGDLIGRSGVSSGTVDFINRKNTYTGKLNTDSSLVDLLKYNNFDSSESARASYYSQMGFGDTYTNSKEQNIAMLEWLKKNGYGAKEYASGGFNLKKQLAWTQENGELEYIIRPSDGAILTPLAQGDSVLNSEASKNLWNMATNPMQFIKDNMVMSIPNVSAIGDNSNIENNIQMSISLPGVSNYHDFVTQLQADKKFEKMIVDVTSSALTGNNTLSKYRHKF